MLLMFKDAILKLKINKTQIMKRTLLIALTSILSLLFLSGCASMVDFFNSSARLMETTERTINETGDNIREIKNVTKTIEGFNTKNPDAP